MAAPLIRVRCTRCDSEWDYGCSLREVERHDVEHGKPHLALSCTSCALVGVGRVLFQYDKASDDKFNPPHYAKLEPEPIVAIEGWSLGFCLGNCVKYIARAGRKTSEPVLDDLKKARWYLDREIQRLEKEGKDGTKEG